jgi:hypothetical protein
MFVISQIDLQQDIFILLLGVVVGAVLGAISTYMVAVCLDERANRQKVAGLRELVYGDIITMYVELSEYTLIVRNELAGLNRLNLNDPQTKIDTWTKIKRHAETILEMMDGDWYTRARAEPFIFVQLLDDERTAIGKIYLVQRALIKKAIEKYAKIDEKELMIAKIDVNAVINPTPHFKGLDTLLTTTIGNMKEHMKSGLVRRLLLQVCPDERKWYVTLTFDNDKIREELPKDATDEQIIERAKELTKSHLQKEGEELAEKKNGEPKKSIWAWIRGR